MRRCYSALYTRPLKVPTLSRQFSERVSRLSKLAFLHHLVTTRYTTVDSGQTMHGYIDSFPVPLRLPLPSSVGSSSTASGSKQSKGKGKDTSKAAGGGGGAAGGAVGGQQETYDLVANWTPAELASVQRRVNMASTRASSALPPFSPQSR